MIRERKQKKNMVELQAQDEPIFIYRKYLLKFKWPDKKAKI